jgi:hypothetical protein
MERRKSPRLSVNIPAGIYLKDNPHEVIDAEILSLSEGGAFIHCLAPVDLGKEILVEFRFAETKLIEARIVEQSELKEYVPSRDAEQSVVRWRRVDGKIGFGIQFFGLKPDKVQFIRKMLQHFEPKERSDPKS